MPDSLLIAIALLLRNLPSWIWCILGGLFVCLASGGVLFLIAVYGGGKGQEE